MTYSATIRQPQYAHPKGKENIHVNVGLAERLVTAVAAGVLLAAAVRKRSRVGLLYAAASGLLMHRATSAYCPAYSWLGVSSSSKTLASAEDFFQHGVHIEDSFTVARPPEALYAFWRDFTNLPRFMKYVREVRVISPTRTHWVVHAPVGTVEWDAEIIHDEPNRRIAWRSLENAGVHNTGTVIFSPLPDFHGTLFRAEIEYLPPAGKLGNTLARLFHRDPEVEIREDLRRFKRLLESGLIAAENL